MPITIYREESPENEVWRCDAGWELPTLIHALEEWLKENEVSIPEGPLVADIGFCWRRNAAGGGSVLSPESMRIMGSAQISLFLSEYPGFPEQEEKPRN